MDFLSFYCAYVVLLNNFVLYIFLLKFPLTFPYKKKHYVFDLLHFIDSLINIDIRIQVATFVHRLYIFGLPVVL